MSVKVHIEIKAPLTDEDALLMQGLGMGIVATANATLAGALSPDGEVEEFCAEPDMDGQPCVLPKGHDGDHQIMATQPKEMN